MIRVLLADDQTLVRAGFRSILERQDDITVIGEAGDGAEAVRLTDELAPDLVLMDIRMPIMDGLTATRHVLAGRRPPVVVVLTTFEAEEFVYGALRSGASGFLLKDTSPEQLVDAVRSVIGGDRMLSPAITLRLIEAYVRAPVPGASADAVDGLSERELAVLQLIAAGRSNSEISRELFIAETTVKSHVARILQKLRLRDRVQAVVFAYEHGVVRPGG